MCHQEVSGEIAVDFYGAPDDGNQKNVLSVIITV